MSLRKLKTQEEGARIREELAAAGRHMVMTNGCFDILHAGHVRYLEQARALGDFLLVALNGDGSVCALKGEGRPLNGEQDRAEVLCALESVDAVIIFPETRATAILRRICPQIYAKGGDYTEESLDPDELSALREAGSEIRILPLVPGRSTTRVIERLRTK